MSFTRRNILSSAATLTAAGTFATPSESATSLARGLPFVSVEAFGVRPDALQDQTALLQQAVDAATASFKTLFIPAGSYRFTSLTLQTGSHLAGAGAATKLLVAVDGAGVLASGEIVRVSDLQIRGDRKNATGRALVRGRDVRELSLERLYLSDHARDALHLVRCGGRVSDCHIQDVGRTAIRALDNIGLAVTSNTITSIENNGIQVWRSAIGEDGTQVLGNRISHIRSEAGGDGQNGNGINVFRAGHVIVSDNVISDCAFSAVRGNAASNIQITGNNCARLGEVAIYSEFGFQGAVIANNLIASAAMGISVTNFNDGGRLAVVQGNLIRDLYRRSHIEDIRGTGIGVEADTVVQGNVIENAPTLGIKIGWGRFVRNVVANGNMVRGARVGIGVSGDTEGGSVSLQGNMLADNIIGAIRLMNHNAVLDDDVTTKGNLTLLGNSEV